MKRVLRKSMVVGVVALVVASFGVQPAGAVGAGHVIMTGNVTPDPYLLFASNPSHVLSSGFAITHAMTGTASGTADGQAVICDVSYNVTGTSNFVTGSGSGSFNCSGFFSCPVQYTQTGMMQQQVIGVCQADGTGTPWAFTAGCLFAYMSTTVVANCEFTLL